MSYTKYTWVTGEVITADKLNHIEEGIGSGGLNILPIGEDGTVICNNAAVIPGTFFVREEEDGQFDIFIVIKKYYDDRTYGEFVDTIDTSGGSLATTTWTYNATTGAFEQQE